MGRRCRGPRILAFSCGYFGITEQDPPEAARDKIAGRMLLLDETLSEGLPIMFDFLGVPDPERPVPPMGPEARERQLFDVIRRLTRARSAREPAVFLFEDLHWFDRASEDFLENMVDAAPGNRSLLPTGGDRPRRDRGHRLASGRLETAPLEVFRLNAELRKCATPGLERWLVARG
jgi:AAA ATPase domain